VGNSQRELSPIPASARACGHDTPDPLGPPRQKSPHEVLPSKVAATITRTRATATHFFCPRFARLSSDAATKEVQVEQTLSTTGHAAAACSEIAQKSITAERLGVSPKRRLPAAAVDFLGTRSRQLVVSGFEMHPSVSTTCPGATPQAALEHTLTASAATCARPWHAGFAHHPKRY